MVLRKRKIKLYGDSIGIHLTIEDVIDFDLVQKGVVNIAKIKKIENGNKKKN